MKGPRTQMEKTRQKNGCAIFQGTMDRTVAIPVKSRWANENVPENGLQQ